MEFAKEHPAMLSSISCVRTVHGSGRRHKPLSRPEGRLTGDNDNAVFENGKAQYIRMWKTDPPEGSG